MWPTEVCVTPHHRVSAAQNRTWAQKTLGLPAEVCLWHFWWNLIWNSIWNLKSPMGKIWWNLGGGLSYLPRKHKTFGANFRSNFGENCRKLRFSNFREEHSMDQCRSRLKRSENFERHWSIRILGEIHMDRSLVHTFSWGNSYGPMVLKVLLKFPTTLVLVHGWLFPEHRDLFQKNSFSRRAVLTKDTRSVTSRSATWQSLMAGHPHRKSLSWLPSQDCQSPYVEISTNCQPNSAATVQCEFLARFLRWIWEANFWRVNLRGASFAGKKQKQKIRPKKSGPEFGRPKFVLQHSAPNGGATSPLQKFVPDQFHYVLQIVQSQVMLSSLGGVRADFRAGDEDSNLSVFRVRWFTESPGPLHWTAFLVEILTKPPIQWIAYPSSLKTPFFTEKWGIPKQHMKLQQPRSYNLWMFRFNLLGSQGGNSREMTTASPGHHWRATVAPTTTAKLQQFRANSREMTSQKLNNRCQRSMRFCAASWLLSFQVPLGILWKSASSHPLPKKSSQRGYNNSEPTAVKWRVRNSTIAAKGAWDFVPLHGCCRFKCL